MKTKWACRKNRFSTTYTKQTGYGRVCVSVYVDRNPFNQIGFGFEVSYQDSLSYFLGGGVNYFAEKRKMVDDRIDIACMDMSQIDDFYRKISGELVDFDHVSSWRSALSFVLPENILLTRECVERKQIKTRIEFGLEKAIQTAKSELAETV